MKVNVNPPQSPPKKSRSKLWMIFAVLILILAAAIAIWIIWEIYFNKNDETSTTAPPTIFNGKFNYESSENFDGFMVAPGLKSVQLITDANPSYKFTNLGPNYTMTCYTPISQGAIYYFTLGETIITDFFFTLMNVTFIMLDSHSLSAMINHNTSGELLRVVLAFTEDNLTMTFDASSSSPPINSSIIFKKI